MAVSIYYLNDRKKRLLVAPPRQPALVLVQDGWNDYGYSTYCEAHAWVDGVRSELGAVRVLTQFSTNAHQAIVHPTPPAVYAEFNVLEQFLSLGAGVDYYRNLVGAFGAADAFQLLAAMHDVVFLSRTQPTHPALALQSHDGFKWSLLRDMSGEKALVEAASVLFPNTAVDKALAFNLQYQLPGFRGPHSIDFAFDPESTLPQNIAVVIGVNGAGKTRGLEKLGAWQRTAGSRSEFDGIHRATDNR